MSAPNILLGNDAGETAYIDGIVYRRLPEQPQLGIPNKSIQPGDVQNIQPFTWNYDDSNVFEGENHRTWSGVEVGVSTYVGGNGGSVQAQSSGWSATLLTAQGSGVVRLWGYNNNINFLVNNVSIFTISSAVSQENAFAYRLVEGDVLRVTIGGWPNTANWQFLPDIYETS